MLDSFIDILRTYPALAVFLTVGIGFLIGNIRIHGFSLGSVTSVLLVGVADTGYLFSVLADTIGKDSALKD